MDFYRSTIIRLPELWKLKSFHVSRWASRIRRDNQCVIQALLWQNKWNYEIRWTIYSLQIDFQLHLNSPGTTCKKRTHMAGHTEANMCPRVSPQWCFYFGPYSHSHELANDNSLSLCLSPSVCNWITFVCMLLGKFYPGFIVINEMRQYCVKRVVF